jgi:hypothetical protein
MSKYVVCRPQGGLNDILCQIEKCCRYAEKTGRTVIVDTNYRHSHYFSDEFGSYFHSNQKKLIPSTMELLQLIEQLEIFPSFLNGRLNSYIPLPKEPLKPIIDSNSKQPLTFDFTKNYQQDILLHHQDGGGMLSLFALLRFKLTEPSIRELERRIMLIGGPYTAIHIRHTDYLSDYNEAINILARNPPDKLFIATDSALILEEIKSCLPLTKTFSFAKNLSIDGSPIHSKKILDKSEIYSRNLDAIIDLLMLACSTNLIINKIAERKNFHIKPEYSGYSLLARELCNNKNLISLLIPSFKIKIGLV